MFSAAVCQVYYVYGFALLVTLILLVVVVCVSIVGTYFLLNAGVTALLVCGTCFLMQSPRKYDIDVPSAFVLLGSRGAQQRSAQNDRCWCWHPTTPAAPQRACPHGLHLYAGCLLKLRWCTPAENYHWQWTAFNTAASTAVYVFIYSVRTLRMLQPVADRHIGTHIATLLAAFERRETSDSN